MPGWKYWSWKEKVRRCAEELAERTQRVAKLCVLLQIGWEDALCPKSYPQPTVPMCGTSEDSGSGGEVCLFWLILRQAVPVWLKWSICCSTQTHILELIKDLGLETYPQYNVGKKVYHTGGPGAKIHTYTSSIPALSPFVMMDFVQMLWKVRQRSRLQKLRHRDSIQKQMQRCKATKSEQSSRQCGFIFHTQINRLCATVCVEDPAATPGASRLDSMTVHSYIEKHAWTTGEHLFCLLIKQMCEHLCWLYWDKDCWDKKTVKTTSNWICCLASKNSRCNTAATQQNLPLVCLCK